MMKKLTENILLDLQLEFESFKWEGIAYHGNVISVNYESAVESLQSQFEDFDAIWLSKDIEFAKEFTEKFYKEDSENKIKVIYKSRVTLQNYADIDYKSYQKIININSSDDLHDYIPHLKQLGYDGWITEGDINSNPYDDITVFYPEKSINILQAKVFVDGEWSKWISMDHLEHFIYICKFNNI